MTVVLEVCLGTTCFVMGAQELVALEDRFPETWRDRVEVRTAACFDRCHQKGQGHGPFVRLDGEFFGNATPELVLGLLEEKLGGTL